MSKAGRIQLDLTHMVLFEDNIDKELPVNSSMFYLDLFFLQICLEKSLFLSPSTERLLWF